VVSGTQMDRQVAAAEVVTKHNNFRKKHNSRNRSRNRNLQQNKYNFTSRQHGEQPEQSEYGSYSSAASQLEHS
jgi:hypothetical protein